LSIENGVSAYRQSAAGKASAMKSIIMSIGVARGNITLMVAAALSSGGITRRIMWRRHVAKTCLLLPAGVAAYQCVSIINASGMVMANQSLVA